MGPTYRVGIDPGREFSLLLADELLLETCGVHQQLHLAGSLHERVKVCGFINGSARRQKAVILQNSHATFVSQGLGNFLTFILLQHNAAERFVHNLRAPKVARILADDIEGLSIRRPRLAKRRMRMTSSVDIRPSSMDRAVNHEARRIYSSPVAAYNLTLLVYLDHITGLEHAKILAQPILRVNRRESQTRQNHSRVNPKGVWVNWVPDADVAARPLGVSLASKDAKCAGHVLQLPLPLLMQIIDLGNAGEHISARRKRCHARRLLPLVLGGSGWGLSLHLRLNLERDGFVRGRGSSHIFLGKYSGSSGRKTAIQYQDPVLSRRTVVPRQVIELNVMLPIDVVIL